MLSAKLLPPSQSRGGLLVVLGVLASLAIPAGFAEARGPRGQQLAEFDIGPDGDFILLPVTIGRQEHTFLLSTGLVTTMIDTALRTKFELMRLEPRGLSRRRGKPRERFGGLAATLGNVPLEFPNGVEAGTYDALREKLDLECSGEI